MTVTEFINKLPKVPICYYLCGSRARGTNRPDSDWDVTALYEKDSDIPIKWIVENMDGETGLFFGKFDFHYFAKDWLVFRVHPALLNELFPKGEQRD